MLNQGQEVLVYDDETGEYQQYFYVPENQDGVDENPINVEHNQDSVEHSIEQSIETNNDIVEHLHEQDSEAILSQIEEQSESESKSVKVLNQNQINDLQPGTLIQCNKCWNTFLSADFEEHYNTAHSDPSVSIFEFWRAPIRK